MVFSFLADGARAATAALILSAIGRGAIESPVCVAPGWSRRPSTARLPRRTGPSSHLALQQPSNTRTSDRTQVNRIWPPDMCRMVAALLTI